MVDIVKVSCNIKSDKACEEVGCLLHECRGPDIVLCLWSRKKGRGGVKQNWLELCVCSAYDIDYSSNCEMPIQNNIHVAIGAHTT